MLRQDCLVVERPSLDSFGRVLYIWSNSFYLSWTRFSERITRAEDKEYLVEKLLKIINQLPK